MCVKVVFIAGIATVPLELPAQQHALLDTIVLLAPDILIHIHVLREHIHRLGFLLIQANAHHALRDLIAKFLVRHHQLDFVQLAMCALAIR